jgi:hypothetical protein
MTHENYWTYQAASETPPHPPTMTEADWHKLSPGMRREIGRSGTGTHKWVNGQWILYRRIES